MPKQDFCRPSYCNARSLILALVAQFFFGTVWAQSSQNKCGDFPRADNGPYDYLAVKDHRLQVVEQYHFTPVVENLIRGSTGSIGADLDFTLRAFPNHHRALVSMMRLGETVNSPQPYGARYSVECYLERATRFQPKDNIARLIYATFLVKHNRESEANQQLENAISNTDNAFTHYNAGLIYFDLKNYDKALERAHVAMELGLLRTELRDRLQSVGKWTEPVTAVATATSPGDAASKPGDAISK